MLRYKDINKTTVTNNENVTKTIYQTVKYPDIPLSENDIYVFSVQGDRFDILANQYYGDQSLWWIISSANTAIAGTSLPSDLPQDSLIVPEGIQIRIPADFNNAINNFININK